MPTLRWSRAAGLPYGTRRRVEVARALATGPRLLLLDEPAAGLNEQEQKDLADRIRSFAAEGITVLVVEHNLVFLAALAERLICLDRGKVIAAGLPEAVRREPAVIEAYLGLEADVAELSLAGSLMSALLNIDGLSVSYGQVSALRDVSISVNAWRSGRARRRQRRRQVDAVQIDRRLPAAKERPLALSRKGHERRQPRAARTPRPWLCARGTPRVSRNDRARKS